MTVAFPVLDSQVISSNTTEKKTADKFIPGGPQDYTER